MRRIGIFSGTFDPVHKGHISFALHALKVAKLDDVYFMIEAKPRRKEGMTHYAHRHKMLELALTPYKSLKILEVKDKQYSVTKTMPKLKKIFNDDKIFMLIGSDVVKYIADSKQWPNAELQFKDIGLVIGTRGDTKESEIDAELPGYIKDYYVVTTDKKHASSRHIRASINANQKHHDAVDATHKYIKKNWLYDSVDSSANKS